MKRAAFTALWTRPQVIGAYGKDGRPRPYDADQPLLRTPCDVVIVAIGQSIDAKPFEQIAPVVRGKIQAESDASCRTPRMYSRAAMPLPVRRPLSAR